MKQWIKVLVLVLSSIISFVCLFFIVAFSYDAKQLEYPLTAIMPILSFTVLMIGVILFCVWCYSYKSENKKPAILFVSIAVCVLACVLLAITPIVNTVLSKEYTIDTTNLMEISEYSDMEVLEYLNGQGYEFEISELGSSYITEYVYVSNDNNGIIFQKYSNPLIGTHYTWTNEDINDEWADIRSEYENDKEEEKKQYKEYKKWLESEGLTTNQITSVLDYYENYKK